MDDLTSHQLDIFKELFDIVDTESDNAVTIRELSIILHALGGNLSEGEMQDMINQGDTSGSGALDFNEFTQLLLIIMSDTDHPDELREVFRIFDKENNGYISAPELRTIFTSIGLKISDEEIDELVREADVDQDGVILFEEFVNMMTLKNKV